MHVNEDLCLCSGSNDCSGVISAAAGETTALTHANSTNPVLKRLAENCC